MDKEKLIDLLTIQRNIEELYESIDGVKINVSIPNKPYTIIRDRIYRDDVYEIFIIYLNEGYTSPIHSHAENGCILYVLDGHLEETVYSNSDIIHNKTIRAFDKSFITNAIGTHKIKAVTDSISVHIYSPPNFINS